MKIIAMFFASVMTGLVYAASINDTCISFSTKGPDTYLDGSVVLDGECYALVWSKDGVFDGFNAKGECIDALDRIVLVAPVAKNGKCPPILFQVSKDVADELSAGHYAVYLLDTRIAQDGKETPSGFTDGKVELVNGFGSVTASIKLNDATKQNVMEEANPEKGNIANSLASVPSSCQQPKIKSMRIEGDNVFLTVENLKGYMRVQSGEDVKASQSTSAAVQTSGASEDVILVAPKSGSSGFFKVIRNSRE
jgi:hypothetical protein